MDTDMKHMDTTPRGFTVPGETLEHYQQTAVWAEMALALVDTYGPTNEVLAIINDCRENGFPRAFFGLNQWGTHPGGEMPGK